MPNFADPSGMICIVPIAGWVICGAAAYALIAGTALAGTATASAGASTISQMNFGGFNPGQSLAQFLFPPLPEMQFIAPQGGSANEIIANAFAQSQTGGPSLPPEDYASLFQLLADNIPFPQLDDKKLAEICNAGWCGLGGIGWLLTRLGINSQTRVRTDTANDTDDSEGCSLPTAPGVRRQRSAASVPQFATVIEGLAKSAGIDVCINQEFIEIATGKTLGEVDIELRNLLIEVKLTQEYNRADRDQLANVYHHPSINFPFESKQVVFYAPLVEAGGLRRQALVNANSYGSAKNLVYLKDDLADTSVTDFARFLLGI